MVSKQQISLVLEQMVKIRILEQATIIQRSLEKDKNSCDWGKPLKFDSLKFVGMEANSSILWLLEPAPVTSKDRSQLKCKKSPVIEAISKY